MHAKVILLGRNAWTRIALVLSLAPVLLQAAAAPPVGESGHKYQYIHIIHPVRAICGFTRGGTPLHVIKIPGVDTPADFLKIPGVETQVGFETDMIDITDSHGDLTLTCTRADGWSGTRTLVYGSSHYTSSNAPCAPPQTCPQTPWGSEFAVDQYPTVVRMYANDPPKH